MKLSLRSLFAAVGMFLASIGIGQAEEINLAPKFNPFQSPEITLVGHCTDGCTDGCTDCCAPSCTDACTSCAPSRHVGRDFWVTKDRCAGVTGGVDVLFLRPYTSEGTGPGPSQLNFEPSARYWIGYQNCDGLGARIRWFNYDRGDSSLDGVGALPPLGTAQIGTGYEFQYVDFEVTQAVDFRRWNFLTSGGLRWAETNTDSLTYTNLSTVPAIITGNFNYAGSGFDGVGLTTALQATRDLNRTGSLRMTMGARWSALFGNSKGNFVNGAVVNGVPANVVAGNFVVRDTLVNVLELNIGPQYRRQLRNGAYLTLGAGFEAQYYSNALGVGSTDIGLAGFSTSIGLTR